MPTDYPTERSRGEEFAERYLTHVMGELAGQPLVFAAWQSTLLRRIFERKDAEGYRIVRNFYLSVPRKAGKTTLAAAIALYMLLSDPEPGAEIYAASTAAKQARLVFDIAKQMVRANPTLRKRVKVLQHALVYKDRAFKPLTNEARTSHGLNPSCVIIDELHTFETQADREFHEALTTAQGARRQPLTIYLTTAGYDSNSLCGEIDQYAQKVAAGIVEDPTFGSFISRADPEDDWRDPETWKKANPNFGVSAREAYYREKAARAEDSPVNALEFQRYLLNMWVENGAAYIHLSDRGACDFAVHPEHLEGRECCGALDLSNTTDLTAFVLTFPPQEAGEPYQVLPFAWLPAENMRVRKYMVPYDVWAREGFLELTPGNALTMPTSSVASWSWPSATASGKSTSTAGARYRSRQPSRTRDYSSSSSVRGSSRSVRRPSSSWLSSSRSE
jgi:phage terminase large subunit-like protein